MILLHSIQVASVTAYGLRQLLLTRAWSLGVDVGRTSPEMVVELEGMAALLAVELLLTGS